MAIIYSYPINTNILATDIIVGSSTAIFNGRPKNQTKSFEIQDLAVYFASVIVPPGSYVPYTGATGPVNLGAYDLTLNGATIGRGGGQVYSNIVFGLSSLLNNTTGQNNTYVGFSSGYYNTIGSYNSAIGTFASQFTTTGDYNTAIGNNALYTNTTGSYNLAIGSGALFSNTTGSSNIAIGYGAQAQNPIDNNSIVIGSSATGVGSNTVVLGNSSITTTRLRGNVQGGAFIKDGGTNLQYLLADGSVTTGPVLTGFVPYTGATGPVNLGPYNLTVNSISVGRGSGGLGSNTVLGNSALSANVTGTQITAIGNFALDNNTANNNTAVGFKAMTTNTTGNTNTSVGSESLQTNLSGNENSAFGYRALYTATSAVKNNAFGRLALGNILTGNQNIGIGNNAGLLTATANQNTTGGFSIYIGNDTKPSLDSNQNEIVIGYNANGIGSNSVVLGNTNILTTRLRGIVQGGSFVKDTGTVYETLLANGSVSTSGTLYKATSTAYQLVSGTSYFYSAVIPSNIFASGDNLKINTITATTAITVSPVIMRYYINTTPSIVGAIQIANWSGNAGSISYPMDRTYWVNGGDFYARNFTSSSPSSTNTGTTAINNTPIPGGSFYIIVEIITTAPDLAGLLNFQIIKS